MNPPSVPAAPVELAPLPAPPPTRWERLQERLARLEDREGEPGSIRLIVLRRTLLVASAVTAPAWPLLGAALALSPSLRQTLVSRPADLLAILGGLLGPLPIFLGLRYRKRLALVVLLVWAAGLGIVAASHRDWDSALGHTLLFILIASCWRDVDQ